MPSCRAQLTDRDQAQLGPTGATTCTSLPSRHYAAATTDSYRARGGNDHQGRQSSFVSASCLDLLSPASSSRVTGTVAIVGEYGDREAAARRRLREQRAAEELAAVEAQALQRREQQERAKREQKEKQRERQEQQQRRASAEAMRPDLEAAAAAIRRLGFDCELPPQSEGRLIPLWEQPLRYSIAESIAGVAKRRRHSQVGWEIRVGLWVSVTADGAQLDLGGIPGEAEERAARMGEFLDFVATWVALNDGRTPSSGGRPEATRLPLAVSVVVAAGVLVGLLYNVVVGWADHRADSSTEWRWSYNALRWVVLEQLAPLAALGGAAAVGLAAWHTGRSSAGDLRADVTVATGLAAIGLALLPILVVAVLLTAKVVLIALLVGVILVVAGALIHDQFW